MVLRWTAAGVLEAERGFRKFIGYRAMPALVAALRPHDTNRARSGVDETEKATDNEAATQFQQRGGHRPGRIRP
jgi:putative transposase